jgi:cobalt/nickel transport protein
MRYLRPFLLTVALLGPVVPAWPHFTMLLPEKPSAKKGEPVTFTYQWGHPFEHQLFDALPPAEIEVNAPVPAPRMLTSTPEEVSGGAGAKKVRVYRFRYTPEDRRDYVFVLRGQPVWMEEDQAFFQDTVKVVLHVQAQRGWDEALGGFELIPLTRPYGLQPGMVFQARVSADGKPLAGALAEIERYNPTPPKMLPPDEQITRTAKTDPNGVVTCTLPEAGWWCIAAERDGGKKEQNGKAYPVRQRAILWVYVDEKAAGK